MWQDIIRGKEYEGDMRRGSDEWEHGKGVGGF